MRQSVRQFWLNQHSKQCAWIQACGGDLAGYIEKYHHKYGRTLDNAKAIYDADMQELQRIEEKLRK